MFEGEKDSKASFGGRLPNMKEGSNSGGAELPLHEDELFYVCDKAPNQNACCRTFKGKYVALLFLCSGPVSNRTGLNTSRGTF